MARPDLSDAVWRKSSFSGGANGGGQCVEVAALGDDRVAVRNSNARDAGTLLFSCAEMAVWVRDIKSGRFDDLA